MGILRDIGAPGLIIIVLGALLIFGPSSGKRLGPKMRRAPRTYHYRPRSPPHLWS